MNLESELCEKNVGSEQIRKDEKSFLNFSSLVRKNIVEGWNKEKGQR